MELHENTRLFELFSLPETRDDLKGVHEAVAARIGATVEAKDARAIAAKLATFRSDTVAASVRQMLNVDVFAMLVGAWRVLDQVHRAAAKSLVPPREEQKVDLARHKLEAKLRPRLVVSLHGIDLCDLEFDVLLAADVASAKLFIAEGRLTAVQPGPVTGSVTLAMHDQELKKWAQDFELLPAYRFSRPWALAEQKPLPTAAASAAA